jgi:putative ABC transport system permease protein
MSALASWRSAIRVARREARRSKGRSTLVVVMIGLPVLALSFAAVSYDMFDLTGDERATRSMGAADARIIWEYDTAVEQDPSGEFSWPANPLGGPVMIGKDADGGAQPWRPTEAELLAKLPAGTTLLSMRKGSAALRTATGSGDLNVVSIDATSPLTRGYVEMLTGRAPTAPTEVALTEQATQRLGVGLGGTVTSADGERSYTVVGLVEFPSALEQLVLFPPIADEHPKGFSLGRVWLADTPAPVTWQRVRELNASGIAVASREVFIDPPPAEQVPNFYSDAITTEEFGAGVLVAGLALLEIILLAGPAFAVSARRRQRQLALVAANGGTPAHVRRIVLADGVVLGALGAGVGIAAGIAAAFAARPFIEELLTHSRAGGYRIFPAALAAIACLAVVTGLLAALVPAFVTARQNVVASLAGRRGVTRSKKRWIALGLAMVATGSAVVIGGTLIRSAQTMLAGLVIGELGLVLCTPALVGLIARIGRILPVAPRIALRDAARNRAAAAPAISAVMAAVAGSVAIGLYIDSNRALQEGQFQPVFPVGRVTVFFDQAAPDAPTPARIESTLRSSLPIDEVRSVSHLECADQPDGTGADPEPSPSQGPADPKMVPEKYCQMEPMQAPEYACPYLETARTGAPALTTEQQRDARKDPRCGQRQMRGGTLLVGDDGSALALLTGASAEEVAAAAAVLRSGGVVVADPRYVKDGSVTFKITEAYSEEDGVREESRTMTFPAYLVTTGVAGAASVVSPAAATQAGLVSVPGGMLIASTLREPTLAEEDRMRHQLEAIKASGGIERNYTLELPVEVWLIMGAAALITLGAAAIGTGLAAADGRADLSTLASVGASPRMRRGLSVSQTGVIAGLGSVLGAAAGLGAAVAVLAAMNRQWESIWPGPDPLPIIVPWLSLLMALVVVPVVAILGAGLFTRSRLPIERRL